jgi:hypothetical protein
MCTFFKLIRLKLLSIKILSTDRCGKEKSERAVPFLEVAQWSEHS